MKNPNGYGGISKLPGNRRRPYRVRLTTVWQQEEGNRRKKNTILWAIMPSAVLPLSPWLITINVPTT